MNPARRLTQALIVSGALNIALLAIFFYWTVKEKPPTPYYQLKPADELQQHPPLADERTSEEVIREYKLMPLQQLIARLGQSQLVENGYTQRDLALACLVSCHDFDLPRALKGLPAPSQKRILSYTVPNGIREELVIYPGLTEQQFQAIVEFANTEKWPLTGKGLFLALQKKKDQSEDPSLAEAFFLTPEFLAVETLFKRSEATIDKKQLLTIILEGNWELVSSFTEQQKASQDLSPARRQRFLLDAIAKGSKVATFTLLQTDGDFAVRKLDDRSVLYILKLLDHETPEAKAYALALLSSPRSDPVLHLAAVRLYEFAGESVPAAYSHEDALTRFLPKARSAPKTLPTHPPLVYQQPAPAPKPAKVVAAAKPKPAPAKDRLYVVQEGDSLWKISRRFGIDVDVLRKHNRLQNDFLKPGTPLRIP